MLSARRKLLGVPICDAPGELPGELLPTSDPAPADSCTFEVVGISDSFCGCRTLKPKRAPSVFLQMIAAIQHQQQQQQKLITKMKGTTTSC